MTTFFNSWEDNFNYLPKVVSPENNETEDEPMNDPHISGKRDHPAFSDVPCEGCGKLPREGRTMGCPDCDEVDEPTIVLDFDPDEWERRYIESMKRRVSRRLASISEDERGQLSRGQMGMMDEDNPEGNIGTPVIAAFDDDNPGTDEDHNLTDTDNVEEDADENYGGNNKRKNTESGIATLVAMGGIGTIDPQHLKSLEDDDENIHYGEEEI